MQILLKIEIYFNISTKKANLIAKTGKSIENLMSFQQEFSTSLLKNS